MNNLLIEALGAIGSTLPVTLYRVQAVTLDSAGYETTVFAPGEVVSIASAQAVPRSLYERMGLQLSKKYVTLFIPQSVLGVERGAGGAQFEYGGERFAIESTTDWYGQAGWLEALAVRL